jgi:uncharacterized protein (TIRG00374 family)
LASHFSIPRWGWRKFIFAVLLLLFGLLLVHKWGQIELLLHTLRRGRIEWVIVAVLLQVGTMINQPALYQSLYGLLDLPIRWRELAPVVWAAHFVNIVTPAAGLGGTSLLFDEARRRGFDLGRVTLANALYFLLNFIWFVILLGFSLLMLFFWHDLKPYEVAVAIVPTVGVVLAVTGLVMIATCPQVFSRLLFSAARSVNYLSMRILRRSLWDESAVVELASTFSRTVGTLSTARLRLFRPCLHAVLVDGLEILVLWACFAAFPGMGAEVTPTMVVVGYSLGTLFLVVSVTPQGLGVVEGVMTAIFVSLGVSLERAAVVVLVYRGLSFWLPLCIGLLAMRWTPNFRDKSGVRVANPAAITTEEL